MFTHYFCFNSIIFHRDSEKKEGREHNRQQRTVRFGADKIDRRTTLQNRTVPKREITLWSRGKMVYELKILRNQQPTTTTKLTKWTEWAMGKSSWLIIFGSLWIASAKMLITKSGMNVWPVCASAHAHWRIRKQFEPKLNNSLSNDSWTLFFEGVKIFSFFLLLSHFAIRNFAVKNCQHRKTVLHSAQSPQTLNLEAMSQAWSIWIDGDFNIVDETERLIYYTINRFPLSLSLIARLRFAPLNIHFPFIIASFFLSIFLSFTIRAVFFFLLFLLVSR